MAKRFGKKDGIFLGILFILILGGCILFYFLKPGEGTWVEVTINGEFYGNYDLKKEQTVDIIIKERMANVLDIKDGVADMIQADCPDKLCVHQNAISKGTETIVCLPNRVVAEVIRAEETSEFDSFAK